MDKSGTETFTVSYSAKDVILYALSIGFGSSVEQYNHDLRYLYEDHPEFSTVPTFCLTLIFWAQRVVGRDGPCSAIPAFPPPMMRAMGVLPRRFHRRDGVNIDQYPLLHAFQSVSWNHDMPAPTRWKDITTTLEGRFLSVAPKAMGTFVTTETNVCAATSADGQPVHTLCTVQSTVLVLGLPSELVIPFGESGDLPRTPQRTVKKEQLFDLDCCIAPNQALLYRLASGDSNRIHVDPSANPLLGGGNNEGPGGCLLHGLCTLGIATRVILQFLHQDNKSQTFSVRQLSGKFVKPVFANDCLHVKAWKLACSDRTALQIEFAVQNKSSGETVLDKGHMMLERNGDKSKGTVSRL